MARPVRFRRRPARLPQQAAGVGAQFAQIQLFGHAMLLIEVAARAGEALGEADGRKTAGAITRAAILGFVHKTFDHQHGMLPAGLPVLAQTAQTQAEDPRGQIGKTRPRGQDEEAAVVDDQAQATGALARTPTQPRFARLEMECGGAESNEGDPLAVEFGHVTQRLARQHGRVQIMFFLQQPVKGGPLVLRQQPEADPRQEFSFVGNRCVNHAPMLPQGRAKVQSFFSARIPACFPPPQVNQPWFLHIRADFRFHLLFQTGYILLFPSCPECSTA
jgi:hypothetical protein